jgi:hypothetical protein
MMNIQIGEVSRRAWLGEEEDLLHSDNLLRAYNGPAELVEDHQQQGWFLSKDAILSGLGVLGIKQGASHDTSKTSKKENCAQGPFKLIYSHCDICGGAILVQFNHALYLEI